MFWLVALFAIALTAYAIYCFNRARFLADPDNAPPVFGHELPHEYDANAEPRKTPTGGVLTETLPCCKFCGGGKNHSVHHGVRWAPKPEKEVKL